MYVFDIKIRYDDERILEEQILNCIRDFLVYVWS